MTDEATTSPQWGLAPPSRPWRPRLRVIAAVSVTGILGLTGWGLLEGPSFAERHMRDAEDHCYWSFNRRPVEPLPNGYVPFDGDPYEACINRYLNGLPQD